MTKHLVRVLSFALCLVMVLGTLPAARAQTLDGSTNPQLRNMHYDENGEIYFTEAAELEALAAQVKNYPDVYFSCTYEGGEILELTSNVTIPQNMAVYCYTGPSGHVRITSSADVKVEGFLGANKLEVAGKLTVGQSGGCAVSNALTVTGQVQLDGYMNLLAGLGTNVTGADKISCGVKGSVWVVCNFANEEQLRQQIDAASKAPANWYYDCYNAAASVHLASKLTVPANVCISAGSTEQGDTFTLTGQTVTVYGEIDAYTTTVIQNDLIIEETGCLYADQTASNAVLTLEGKIFCEGSMDLLHRTVMKKDLFLGPNGWMHVTAPVTMEGKVENQGVIDFYYGSGIAMTFTQPEHYDDGEGDETGTIYINGSDPEIPNGVFVGPKLSDFKVKYVPAGGLDTPYWMLTNYQDTAPQPPQSENKDVTAMYRLYNPNSGEHFYTGSVEEKNMLVSVGWQYEGIAWNAPTKHGTLVYRLYNPNNGDHHYTMSDVERDNLVAVGWQYEGVAWNSASSSNVPMYRLYNPNADCGSHHYTGSVQERDYLVSLGWHYEGIGWYGIA